MKPRTAVVLLLVTACASVDEAPLPGYVLVFDQDADDAVVAADFAFSDPSAWSWTAAGELELKGASDYAPPHRSPTSIALLPHTDVADFVLEAEVLQTGREYGHRDLCLFFAFQSAERYYYAHLATAPDDHAHNVFLVDRAPRTRVGEIPARGVDWGDGVWHRVRLERTSADGAIRVFFDGAPSAVLSASDATLPRGRVGLGSFDDTGRFRRIRVWAPAGSALAVASADPFGR